MIRGEDYDRMRPSKSIVLLQRIATTCNFRPVHNTGYHPYAFSARRTAIIHAVPSPLFATDLVPSAASTFVDREIFQHFVTAQFVMIMIN